LKEYATFAMKEMYTFFCTDKCTRRREKKFIRVDFWITFAELGTFVFQIAHSLITLERLLISAANEQFIQMSDEWQAN